MSRKRPKANAKRRGGRPKKAGPRYPSGKLKAPGPNESMLERRRALCADTRMATCPMDAAFANGWITEREHRAGQLFAETYRRTGIESRRGAAGSDLEASTGLADVRGVSFAELSDKEIAWLWDAAMRDAGGEARDREESAAKAMDRWKALNEVLSQAQRQVMFSVCVREHWPAWVLATAQGQTLTARHEAERDGLLGALARIRSTVVAPKALEPEAKEDRRQSTGRLVEEVTTYVTEEGQPLYQAVIRRRV